MDDIKIKKRNTSFGKRMDTVGYKESTSPASERSQKTNMKIKTLIVFVVILVGLVSVFLLINKNNSDYYESNVSQDVGIFDSKSYYGFVTDEIVFFGKVSVTDRLFYKLSDVFYTDAIDKAKTSDTTGKEQKNSSTIKLIKLGTEYYKFEDEVILPREKVKQIFLLSEGSPILKAILNYNK